MMTDKEKVLFPSAETLAKLDELIAARTELAAKREQAERRLRLAENQKNAVEAMGGDPVALVRDRRIDVENLDAELNKIRNELNQVCRLEHARFAQLKSAAWVTVREEFIAPNVARITEAIESFGDAISAVTEHLKDTGSPDPSAHLSCTASLDAGLRAWNAAVVKAGGPGNYLIAEDHSLGLAVVNSLAAELRDVGEKLEVNFNRLRTALRMEQLKTFDGWQRPEVKPVAQPQTLIDPVFWSGDAFKNQNGTNPDAL